MTCPTSLLIDAGIEKLHTREIGGLGPDRLHLHRGQLKHYLEQVNDILRETLEKTGSKPDVYLTGKLSAQARNLLSHGTRLHPEAVLWQAARHLAAHPDKGLPPVESVAIIDFSASGFCIAAARHSDTLAPHSLEKNPSCGAGSGINLRRILEKLNIAADDADQILCGYLGRQGRASRRALPVRMERCGVFSVSATVSDKNQGIPIEHALAVTMKSETAKAVSRVPRDVGRVYLTGGVFRWKFLRDCAADMLSDQGIEDIVYDEHQSLVFVGMEALRENHSREKNKIHRPSAVPTGKTRQIPLPSFQELQEQLTAAGQYVNRRSADEAMDAAAISAQQPVHIALDIGSSLAKMIITEAISGKTIFRHCLPNKGDALQTLRRSLAILEEAGCMGLPVQYWGLTGSGRYQMQRILQAVYPHLRERIFTRVENEAHVLGSLEILSDHIAVLAQTGHSLVHDDRGILVDIGGEDTKISIIDVQRKALSENAMNCKCSAGTGSLMDILRDLLDIRDVATAYRMAHQAERAWRMNATCAVFLMEEARKMQAAGVDTGEILASCCYAIVENMARTLWHQVNISPQSVLLLHGQTMLSEPLALATIHRLSTHCGGPVYGLVPPDPGYRACLGLQKQIPLQTPVIDQICAWEKVTGWNYHRKLFSCSGSICGNEQMRCTRATLSSGDRDASVRLNIGGCASVNEREALRASGDHRVPDAYREIWQWISKRHPQTESADRLIIPRCFSLSQQAYLFAKCFDYAGIPVHTDTVQAHDIRAGQKYFNLDTCAPNMGTAGQLTRLAAEPHGLIFLPQIDFLPTGGASLGRTCTTNQGGIWAAIQFAREDHPQARFMVREANLGEADLAAMTRQLWRSLADVFAFYGARISLPRFREIWEASLTARAEMDREKAELAAIYLEEAADKNIPVTVVCGREYVLNPGIYDQHISKLLRDKGIMPIPSYALDAELDCVLGHIYWKNTHDVASKVKAIAGGTLSATIREPRLRAALLRLEKSPSGGQLTHALVTTFRCGPDSVTAPLMQEIAKSVPGLWIQSDGTIAELAHLESRISTHLRRLSQKPEIGTNPPQTLRLEILTDFNLDALNGNTDVVYFPTLSDNSIMTSLARAMGLAAIDNYSDENFDLGQKVRKGQQYVGNDACIPLAAVFADMLSAVEDFMERRLADDPQVRGKSRIILFMNGGDGPCRLGQYLHVFKLAFARIFGSPVIPGPGAPGQTGSFQIRFLENLSSSVAGRNDYSALMEPWAGILAYQAVVVHGLCHSLLLQAAASCPDEKTYAAMTFDYRQLQHDIRYQIERKAPPRKAARQIVDRISRQYPALGGPAKYLGYGLWQNFGLRGIMRHFAKKWIFPDRINRQRNPSLLRIHLDGEVYMRTSLSQEVLRLLLQHLGFGTFVMTLTPTWSFFEAVLHTRMLAAGERIADIDHAQAMDDPVAREEKKRQQTIIRDSQTAIGNLRNILAGPLYAAAGVDMPHAMSDVYTAAAPVIPTAKPYGELIPFVGESILRCRENTDIILNLLPEGCMVSGMGDMLIPSIIACAETTARTTIASLISREGEVQEDQLRLALLKAKRNPWSGILTDGTAS